MINYNYNSSLIITKISTEGSYPENPRKYFEVFYKCAEVFIYAKFCFTVEVNPSLHRVYKWKE